MKFLELPAGGDKHLVSLALGGGKLGFGGNTLIFYVGISISLS